nr:ROK family protein [Granulicella aggregans]
MRVLNLLRECGSCSKADLVRASGLSAPTITNVVADLLASDLIKPLGEGESNGGRPPDMISFKAERGCVLAVEISSKMLSLLLTDLNGKELAYTQMLLEDKKTTPDAICIYIGEEIRRVLRQSKKKKEQLLVLVVGLPAITNVDDGVVMSISTLENWRSVPLREKLSRIVDCLVILENDTNLAAVGERYSGAAQGQDTFILIRIGPNVSAGIVLDGQIFHGSQWSAGEIAYLRLPNTSRRHPTLHEFGELESVLTGAGIVESWRDANSKGSPGARRAVEVNALDVLDLAQAGDITAEKIVQQRAGMVSDIIINLSLILNPGLILLGGEVGEHPALVSAVQRQLQESEFAVTQIDSAKLGSTSVLWGAIAVALGVIPSVLLPEPRA